MDTKKGISWPGWEIVRRIGSGSFGTVYEIQRDIYGDVEKGALKVITIPHNEDEVDYLRCSGLDDASITQTFHQQVGDIAKEYKLMAQLRENPNIVRCDDFRDIQHDDGLGWDIYIKMELLTPLMKSLNRVYSEEQIIRMGMDICNALIDCQNQNIIHRDIKPQNVFVSESGRFKLGDFGIARTIERTTHATAGIGTYSYMAPEVERNEPYGKTADIYSLGLMMYWLLNERRGPFMPLPPKVPKYGDEEQARRRRFSGEPIPPPKNGSAKLKVIVMRACNLKPEDRFESAFEMFTALKELVENQSVVSDTELSLPSKEIYNDVDLTEERPQWGEKTESHLIAKQNPEQVLDDATVGPVFGCQQVKAETLKSPKTLSVQPYVGSEKLIETEAPEDKQTGIGLPNGFWRCICGRVNAAYVSSCACGINKRELSLSPEQFIDLQPRGKRNTPEVKQKPKTEIDDDATVGPVFGCQQIKAEMHKTPKTIPAHPDTGNNKHKNTKALEHNQTGVAFSNGFWKCVCGRINAAYVSTCACGVNKRELKLLPEQFVGVQSQKQRSIPNVSSVSAKIPQDFWGCSCGRLNAAYVSTCACGTSKWSIVGNSN